MSHAELCPVCKGVGKVASVPDRETTAACTAEICHGCNGKGWVEVSDKAGSPVIQAPPRQLYYSPWWYYSPVYPYWYYSPVYPYWTWYYRTDSNEAKKEKEEK